MRPLFILLACALASACTLNWTDETPVFPLVGDAPPLSSYTKVSRMISGRATLVTAVDGVQWAAMCEFWSSGSGNSGRNCKRMHLVRLSPSGEPAAEETLEASTFEFHGGAVYAFLDDMDAMSRTLTVHRLGDPNAVDLKVTLPLKTGLLSANDAGDGDTFLYLAQDKATTQFDVFHRPDGKVYSVALPAGVDPTGTNDKRPLTARFTEDGQTLVVRTADGILRSYYRSDPAVTDFGKRPTTWFLDEARRQIITCGDDGLHALPMISLDGPVGDNERVLVTSAIDPVSLSTTADDAYFAKNDALWTVALDGNSPAVEVAAGGARAWALSPGGLVAYSTQSAVTYSASAGDGWISGNRIMERGRRLTFSSDDRRVRYLENAATLGGYGDLKSRLVAGGDAQTLAINVASYSEVVSGKLIAVENAVYGGSWNRLVVIDEAASEKRLLAQGASNYVLTTDRKTVIADVVSGASGYDVYRLPAP